MYVQELLAMGTTEYPSVYILGEYWKCEESGREDKRLRYTATARLNCLSGGIYESVIPCRNSQNLVTRHPTSRPGQSAEQRPARIEARS